MRKATPKRLSQSARTSPVGPAPTIRTCRCSISARSDFVQPHHDWRVMMGGVGRKRISAHSGSPRRLRRGVLLAGTTTYELMSGSVSQIAQPVFRPTGSHARLVFRAWPHGGRKPLSAPLRTPRILPRARGVDQHPVPEAGAELCNVAILHRRAGIDRRAENPRKNDDATFAGVHPVSERPFNLLVIRGIDVLLHHNDVLVAVLGGAVAPERRSYLLGLPLVVFFDLDADVDAIRNRRRIDVENTGDAGAVENVPGDARALHRRHDAVLAVRPWQGALQRTAEDRIAAVSDAGDFHRRTRRGKVGHVAGELAERTFNLVACPIVAYISLQHDLRCCGKLAVHGFATDQAARIPAGSGPHIPPAYHGP